MTPETIAILAVGAALAGLVWQSHRALRTDLGGRMDRIEGVMKDQGERIARIEGMLHLHLGRNADVTAPAAPAE